MNGLSSNRMYHLSDMSLSYNDWPPTTSSPALSSLMNSFRCGCIGHRERHRRRRRRPSAPPTRRNAIVINLKCGVFFDKYVGAAFDLAALAHINLKDFHLVPRHRLHWHLHFLSRGVFWRDSREGFK